MLQSLFGVNLGPRAAAIAGGIFAQIDGALSLRGDGPPGANPF